MNELEYLTQLTTAAARHIWGVDEEIRLGQPALGGYYCIVVNGIKVTEYFPINELYAYIRGMVDYQHNFLTAPCAQTEGR